MCTKVISIWRLTPSMRSCTKREILIAIYTSEIFSEIHHSTTYILIVLTFLHVSQNSVDFQISNAPDNIWKDSKCSKELWYDWEFLKVTENYSREVMMESCQLPSLVSVQTPNHADWNRNMVAKWAHADWNQAW